MEKGSDKSGQSSRPTLAPCLGVGVMGDSVGHCFPRVVSPPAQIHATNLFMSTKGLD